MNRAALVTAAALYLIAGLSFAEGGRKVKIEYLKEEPPTGTVSHGKIVYVDDGTCPEGEVKEITGGSQAKSILRQVRCVKRPD